LVVIEAIPGKTGESTSMDDSNVRIGCGSTVYASRYLTNSLPDTLKPAEENVNR
jgi:hypothetical protein